MGDDNVQTFRGFHNARKRIVTLAWLHSRPGYHRRIDPAHIAYLSLTTNDVPTLISQSCSRVVSS